ncbi:MULTISPECIES: anthranilate phosphoribosyltransferase [Vitreoscilla]|uniref:Anthranilate phosphoribosyltransferase n=1 Tax=Vitreoscilla stercoraria TaxID=61 RepID=A0ABY4E7K1_VITST|nr:MULTISPECIES: anthranilate phosphoribosyltransferase [Vitreoscilla]AUZ04544.1 anthranilate phosphoribosyltransferase [Vitreoscilla sp. C1]UOO91749.1 anthranilate phosphoribosyltransferase [Vitreoscilla stercoraria]
MITATEALNRLIDQNELFYDEMTDLMRQIMSGQLPAEVVAALLIGLRIKVETVSEITAAANVMREFATKVPTQNKQHLVDIVGTGGDQAHTFNISTTSMFVAAGAGARIAKHGGRAVSSSSGAADIIERMGVAMTLSSEQVGRCIDEIGLGFMFAPNHHSAMKYVAPVRKALGVRTIFNILGPLTNPADAPNQVLGVFHRDLVGILSRVSQQMGREHVLVVTGSDGLDELTITGKSHIAELKNGRIEQYTIHPEDFGLAVIDDLRPLKAQTAEESYVKMNSVLDGEASPCRDIVVLNAAATLIAANLADGFESGVAMAQAAIDNGKAKQARQQLIDFSQQLAAQD